MVVGLRRDAGMPAGSSVQALPPTEVFAVVASSSRGLSSAEAAARLARGGRNELPRPPGRSPVRQFLAQFSDLFAVTLLAAAGITLLAYGLGRPHDTGNLQLAVAILAVVLINAAIGFGQEYTAERTAEALQAMVPHRARVIRDGERIEVPTADLVVGDLVVLEAGDAVSADCRVVEAHDLAVNNMALTGESDPARRTADPDAAGIARLDARNAVWMGTTVAGGTGKAVVTATGPATEFGRIFRLTAGTSADRSPLQRQVAIMARLVAAVAFALGVLLFLIRLPAGDSVVGTFVFALGVMVALVPQGLPATLSVALAIGVRRMARRHALIKKLVAVETLGSTTVICTDKTGTLTKAEMTVQSIWTPAGMHQVTGVGYAPDGTVQDAESVRELLRVAALCCDARLLPPTAVDGWRVLGDTTEGALLTAAARAGLDLDAERAAAPRVGEPVRLGPQADDHVAPAERPDLGIRQGGATGVAGPLCARPGRCHDRGPGPGGVRTGARRQRRDGPLRAARARRGRPRSERQPDRSGRRRSRADPAVVAAVIRDGQPAVPSNSYRFQPGDTILVVTSAATNQDIHDLFQ